MARDVRYEPNIEGLGKIMTGRGVEAMLGARAQAGKQFAEGMAPRRTGDYAASFSVSTSSRGAGRWSDRATAYLYNDSDHAVAVEFQNDERVLGRSVDVIERG